MSEPLARVRDDEPGVIPCALHDKLDATPRPGCPTCVVQEISNNAHYDDRMDLDRHRFGHYVDQRVMPHSRTADDIRSKDVQANRTCTAGLIEKIPAYINNQTCFVTDLAQADPERSACF